MLRCGSIALQAGLLLRTSCAWVLSYCRIVPIAGLSAAPIATHATLPAAALVLYMVVLHQMHITGVSNSAYICTMHHITGIIMLSILIVHATRGIVCRNRLASTLLMQLQYNIN